MKDPKEEIVNSVFSKYIKERTVQKDDINHLICQKCGGKCCVHMGCHLSPNDFKKIDEQFITDFIIESQCISIDWWEDEDPIYFLRTRNVGAGIIDPSYGGMCSLWRPYGCMLKDTLRPFGGLMLKPVEDGLCDPLYTKRQCAIDWYKCDNILEKVHHNITVRDYV